MFITFILSQKELIIFFLILNNIDIIPKTNRNNL